MAATPQGKAPQQGGQGAASPWQRDEQTVVVLCTAPDAEVGARLGRGLVEARLAACVNVVPGLRSFYHWKGALQDDREVLLVIKSRRERLEALTRWLSQEHPYEVPEILALPIVGGAAPYLAWVAEQTRPAGAAPGT